MSNDEHCASNPRVGIVMGSRSDWPSMINASEVLKQLGIPYEAKVMSAHRTPARVHAWVNSARDRGIQVIIAGAGGAAHLAGVVASLTSLPVIGIPMKTSALGGLDSLLSTVQMPRGIPVATMGIGDAGARNGGLFAAAICAGLDPEVAIRLETFRKEQTASIPESVVD